LGRVVVGEGGPSLDAAERRLSGVDALGPGDAWAVGSRGARQLYTHWNGTRWRVVDGPVDDHGVVSDVAAVAHDDAWAVGWQWPDVSTAVWHWDGSIWSRVDTPAIDGFLRGVDAVDDHVIVTGIEFGPPGDEASAILLKGPRSWRRVPIDGAAIPQGGLSDVNGRWAVGSHMEEGPSVPWAIHRSPDGWNSVPISGVDLTTTLHSVTEMPGDEAWAFGERDALEEPLPFVWEILHWDGVAWTRDPGPAGYEGVPDRIFGSAEVPGTGIVLAVGNMYPNGGITRGMILQRC
jgi:hypothetical protein